MKIEVGKTYVDGNGQEHDIVKYYYSRVYSFRDSDGNEYRQDGARFPVRSAFDLIKEIKLKKDAKIS